MKLKFALGALLLSVMVLSCSKEDDTTNNNNNNNNTGNTLVCTSVPKSFANDVKSIFESKCGGSTCHGSGANAGPGALVTYAQIAAAKTGIKAAVSNGTMPKNGTLTTAQKNSIICWIDDGAKDN